MTWDNKLKRLQDNLGQSAEELASTLGITTRTLSDFLKPVGSGGREPTGPVRRLIDLLLGELDAQGVIKKPLLNLVIIHGDFRAPPGQDAVSMIVDMHAAAGPQRNNEFHYIAVESEQGIQKWIREGLITRRVQPHFFAYETDIPNNSAKDCYFTTTAVWLATQAMRRDLAHITVAADPVKFWPLARELKELAEVEVTFVREAAQDLGESGVEFLKNMGIGIANPSGRKFGHVAKLIPRAGTSDEIAYGYINPETKGALDERIINGGGLFFSYNHMRKDPHGDDETAISELGKNDYVSFSIGMNNRGACATDVALVEKSTTVSIETGPEKTDSQVLKNDSELVEILQDAIKVCADEDGWALSSSVGTRITTLHPDIRKRLSEFGFKNYANIAMKHTNIFDYSADGDGTQHSAACLRLRKASR